MQKSSRRWPTYCSAGALPRRLGVPRDVKVRQRVASALRSCSGGKFEDAPRRIEREIEPDREDENERPTPTAHAIEGATHDSESSREITKRETVYADFIMTASKLVLQAYVNEGVRLDADEQHLIGLANRMRLFAPRSVIEQAEAVIREIVDLSRKPGMDVRKLTVEEVAERRHSDPLLPFSVASRSDLDHVYQTVL
jgi:hypothetical protein